MSILLHALPALLYAGLAAALWRGEWHKDTPDKAPAWLRWALPFALAVHAIELYDALFGANELRFGFGQALAVMLWLAVAIYWFASLKLRVAGILALALPVAAVCALLPMVFPGFALNDAYARSFGFRAHLLAAMAAYSLFTIAALQALLMAGLERRLHSGDLSGPFATLPPLLTLERLLFQVIGAGFVLLTLTIVSGFFFSEAVFGRGWRFDHKTLFALISWLIFAALLLGRRLAGWRGRTALRWLFAGFATLLLAYIGSRFVLEVVLRRAVE